MPSQAHRHGQPDLAPESRFMTTSLSEKRTLLEELDARQDEVLEQLDALNVRIESLLNACLAGRGDAAADPAPAA